MREVLQNHLVFQDVVVLPLVGREELGQVESRMPGYVAQTHSYGARHEHAAAVRPESASSSRPEYGYPPQQPQNGVRCLLRLSESVRSKP